MPTSDEPRAAPSPGAYAGHQMIELERLGACPAECRGRIVRPQATWRPSFAFGGRPFFAPFAASLRRLGSVVTAPHNGGYDLLLRRAPAASGEVYDVLRGRTIVGRIMLSNSSAASQWVWTISYHYHEDRTPTHGYEPSRDAAMKAFFRSWHRE
jgi:hypothetical protein